MTITNNITIAEIEARIDALLADALDLDTLNTKIVQPLERTWSDGRKIHPADKRAWVAGYIAAIIKYRQA